MSDDLLASYATRQNAFYDHLITEYGFSPGGVGHSARSQQKVFGLMARVGDLNGASVLDIGCGYGAFITYLQANNIHPALYNGFDINPHFVVEAQARFPSHNFETFDILTRDDDRRWDYVVCNGAFNPIFHEDNNYRLLDLAMRAMLRLANIGISICVSSAWWGGDSPHDIFFYQPSAVLDIASQHSQNVRLDHTVVPHIFAINLYTASLYTPA